MTPITVKKDSHIMTPLAKNFPTDFSWGTSASAYQVEGAWDVDGKAPSIWDHAITTGTVVTPDGLSGKEGIGQYYRLDEDLDLLATLGAGVHRFSVSWPRVITSDGQPNPAGLDYYERFVDGLLQRGIAPAVNLFHWELPQTLSEQGGWMNQDTAQRFADYAEVVAQRLGDRVKYWFSMNEPTHPSLGGYVGGVLPPFEKHGPHGLDGLGAVHHVLLAHGKALQSIRQYSAPDAEHGIILSLATTLPATNHPDDIAAAARAESIIDPLILDPLLRGRHTEIAAEQMEKWVHDGDLDTISTPMEVLGINWYSNYSAAAPDRAHRHVEEAPAQWGIYSRFADQTPPLGFVLVPQPGIAWSGAHRQISPNGLQLALEGFVSRYGDVERPKVIITENGFGTRDEGTAKNVADDERIRVLTSNLESLHRAIEAGLEVSGYWVWTAWDNIQWTSGMTERFGLIDVDPNTLTRTPKKSFDWFRGVVESNTVVRNIDETSPQVFDVIPNYRDVGGLPITTGGKVAKGQIYRSGLVEDSQEVEDFLGSHNVGSIIDLRSETEANRRPDPHFTGVQLLGLPISSSVDDIDPTDFNLTAYYLEVVRTFPEVIIDVARALAAPKDSATLIHCTAGKDRTGITVGLLLSLLGVSDEAVLRDFEISEDHLGERVHREVQELSPEGADSGLVAALLGSPREALEAVLAEVRHQSGTVRGWFLDNGLSDDEIHSLRSRLVVAG